MDEVELYGDNDRAFWLLNNKNKLVVKDIYLFLKSFPLVVGFRGIWKLKIPLNNRVFLLLMIKNSILAKENLKKGGGLLFIYIS